MRITIATGIYPPDIGGPAKHVKLLRDFLSPQKYKTIVITYGCHKESGVFGVSRGIPFGLRHFIYFVKCLVAALVSDLFYAQDVTAAGLPALLAAKLLRRKFVARIGGDLLWERVAEVANPPLPISEYYRQKRHLWDKPFIYLLTRLVLWMADAVIVPAELLKNIYVDFYGTDPGKIIVVPNPAKAQTQLAPAKLNDTEILFAGRFVAYKNLGFLMKVFDQVRTKNGRGRLVLVGDGPERSNLVALREKLASAESIEIRYPVTPEELAKTIGSAGICIGPALTEFNPNFILECLAAKKPVLLSRENGLSVSLPEEFLFAAQDAKELAGKLEKFLDLSNYSKLSVLAGKLPTGPVWEEVAGQILEIFRKLCP